MNKVLVVVFMYCVAPTHHSSVHLQHSIPFPLFCSQNTSPQLCTRGEQAKFTDTNSLTRRCSIRSCGKCSHYHPPCPELGQQVWNMHCSKLNQINLGTILLNRGQVIIVNRWLFYKFRRCSRCRPSSVGFNKSNLTWKCNNSMTKWIWQTFQCVFVFAL